MKLIHNRYRSYPPVKWTKELINRERYGELRSRLSHGLGRLTAWQHLEIKGYKIDGFDTEEIIKQIRYALRHAGIDPKGFVTRSEVNIVRVWRIPESCKDWKEVAAKALEKGAVMDHGHIEYMGKLQGTAPKADPTYLDELVKENNNA